MSTRRPPSTPWLALWLVTLVGCPTACIHLGEAASSLRSHTSRSVPFQGSFEELTVAIADEAKSLGAHLQGGAPGRAVIVLPDPSGEEKRPAIITVAPAEGGALKIRARYFGDARSAMVHRVHRLLRGIEELAENAPPPASPAQAEPAPEPAPAAEPEPSSSPAPPAPAGSKPSPNRKEKEP